MTLLERADEVSRIGALLSRARAGHGGVLLTLGAAGMGKTALLSATRDEAVRRGMLALWAGGGELEGDLAFGIVRQLFEPRLRAVPSGQRAELWDGAAGLARPVFGDTPVGEGSATMGAVVHGLYWLCANLADHGPLLLAVDDAHWADEASLRFLSHLARRVTDLPVLLVLATRLTAPGRANPVDRALSGVRPENLDLLPLSDVAVAELVRRRLSPAADDLFCRACALATGGNPFLLTEVLSGLRADGVRPVAAEAHRITGLTPATVSRSVLARLARHGPDAVRLGRAIAVLGPAASLAHVAELADLTPARAADRVDALAHEGLVAAGPAIEFPHPLVRTAVYMDMTETVRGVMHKRAARLLDAGGVPPERLVPHLLATAPEGDPWTSRVLRVAASGDLARGAPESAAACLERALAEPPPPALRGALLVEFGRALGMLNRPAEAADALQEALDLTVDLPHRVRLTIKLGMLMVMTGNGARAVQLFGQAHEAIAAAEPGTPMDVLVDISLGRLTAIEPAARWRPPLDVVASRLHGNTTDDRMAWALLAFGAAATADSPCSEVVRLATRAASGPLPPEPWVLVNLASAALTIADDLPSGFDLLDRGIEAARRCGDVAAFGYLSMLRSHTALYAGHLLDAEADAWAALRLARPETQDTPLAAAVLVEALLDRGDPSAAQRILVEQGIEGDQPLSMLIAHFVHVARGRLRLRQGRYRDALADLLPCGEALGAAGYVNPSFAQWRPPAALAHLALGETDDARRLAAEELELARAFQAPRSIALALRTTAAIEGGGPAIELLREAVTLLEGSPAELEHARALVDHGSALRRAGHRRDAQAPLRRGLDLATRCAAQALARRATEELITAGARPRRARLTGPQALTASELRIANMAAGDSTNRDIAEALFVTRRTVELHLSNTYRKLGVRSRRELRQALSQEPPARARIES
ncbi:AAA family ATPase [Streptomyces sp. NPDC002763]|uniref:ATP-binding protein n=1 Tax=Streptomyces sp. NPDC002763 TaxID=3154427 RepID=UPI003320DB0A